MSWCAVCGGGPDRVQSDTLCGGLPRCNVCRADNRGLADWNPRLRRRPVVSPDGNAARRDTNPEAWDEWVRFSESWGQP